MKLDNYQRLTLIYQLLQLEHLDKKQAGSYRMARLAIEDRHASLYEHIFSNRLRDGLAPDAYQETEDIL